MTINNLGHRVRMNLDKRNLLNLPTEGKVVLDGELMPKKKRHLMILLRSNHQVVCQEIICLRIIKSGLDDVNNIY